MNIFRAFIIYLTTYYIDNAENERSYFKISGNKIKYIKQNVPLDKVIKLESSMWMLFRELRHFSELKLKIISKK